MVNTYNKYERLEPRELRRAIRDLNISFGEFARITGTQRGKVLKWLNGREDIPHSCNAFCAVLALPGAIDVLRELAEEFLIEREATQEEEEKPFP